MASWDNIGYHNYRDQDWKKKFMHHEKTGHGNLWGHGSWLHQQGYLIPKSKYASRGHGNKKNKYDKRWKWNPAKNLSMQDKWALYGRVTGKGKAKEGYVTFNIEDINKQNYDNVNWKRQFINRGWWDHVKDSWTDPGSRSDGDSYFQNKYDKWQKFLSGYPDPLTGGPSEDQVTQGVENTDAAAEADMIASIEGYQDTQKNALPWTPSPKTYTKGVRHGLVSGKDTNIASARSHFGRGGGRLKRSKPSGLTISSLNI